MPNIGPIKKYKIIASVATAGDIATLPDSYKKLGMEIFVEDEQIVYSYNPETETFPAPVSSSPIIASGEFNLKDIGANVLTWASGCNAANTAPTGVVVSLTANDTYVDNIQGGIKGSGSISIDSGADNLDNNTSFLRLNVGGVQVSVVVLTNLQTISKSVLISTLIANMQDGWVIENLSGDILTLTESLAEAGTNNGDVITLETISNSTYSTSNPINISGGVTEPSTAFDFQLNGVQISMISNPALYVIPSLIIGKILSGIVYPYNGSIVFDNTGDWALPVTVGTLNDFRIKIQILGVRID